MLLGLLLLGWSAEAQVRFDSNFESGSLGSVQQIRNPRMRGGVRHVYYRIHGHYDPLNPIDTDLAANANWYCFRISGAAGIFFHIEMPSNVTYGASYSYDGEQWSHLSGSESDRHNINKRFARDTVYIALYKPYTYSYLQERLQDWASRPCVTLDTIGFSHEGRPLQMLHITDPDVPQEQKALMWMHGRTHPSESPGSYVLDGLVDYLTSDTEESAGLRRRIDAYILPFSNPDGVAKGLSRSNALGVNQEINFGRSDDSTVVEVRAIKQMFSKLTAHRPLDIMLNSHSQLLETATFWMHRSDSTSATYLRKQWTFTGLACSHNPSIQPHEMSFSYGGIRYAEGWMWKHFADSTLAITIETPYNWYSFDRKLPVNDDNLRDFGKRTMQAVAEYLEISVPGRYIIETPDNPGEDWAAFTADDRSFMGRNAFEAKRSNAVIQYVLESLPPGKYKLYRYESGKCIQPDEGHTDLRTPRGWLKTGTHGWVYVKSINQELTGPFSFTWLAPAAGDLADALLLIKE